MLNVHTLLFEHADTVIERLEGRFGETLQPGGPEPPAGREAVAIGRSGTWRNDQQEGAVKARSLLPAQVSERV